MHGLRALVLILPELTASCKYGDAVECPGMPGQSCAGDQCCPDGQTCPSAHESFSSCARGKVVDCLKPSPPSPPTPPTPTPPTPGPSPPGCHDAPPARPRDARDLNGRAWPRLCVMKTEGHFFGIGDWGGDSQGGHTWANPGKAEQRGGHVSPIDDWGQKYVARQLRARAAKVDPDFVVNAGDNFYPGGLQRSCGSTISGDPTGQFHNVFQSLYNGPGLERKPWFSVLGNHDYGGMSFGAGWDYQILHTWESPVWRMPAQYWSTTVAYDGFSIDLFMLDSNFLDAHAPGTDPNHNLCQGGNCLNITVANCMHVFSEQWSKGLDMLERGLQQSTATWKIINTHFPGPAIANMPRIKELHSKYGIDLIFTGHTHYQTSGEDNGINWIISGGGGGVTSDAKPSTTGHDSAYGFVDFTVNKDTFKYDMHSWGGLEAGHEIIMSSKTLHKKTSPWVDALFV